ncbi:YgjP-like metallopeptidase domain-containing protein [Thiocapsa sp.]|uniref:YgjP-like metallopeptidase domain-containing protein n=1 Tax=Thiocapsa sp. TaxID=2024551 RepID=UPI0025E05A51|nr:YgjP-like metallopeptidase domain-containing protein [Thiocapsa sp.]
MCTADLFADFDGIPKDADKTEFYRHDQNWSNRMTEQCLEYILVHVLTHLPERRHNARFVELMDRHLRQWRQSCDLLNGLRPAHADWGY